MCQEARETETKPGNGGTEILKKPLDKRHKMCYNEYVRWGTPTAKTTKDRGNRHDAMDLNRPAKVSGGEM
jgi:hypothetical protein